MQNPFSKPRGGLAGLYALEDATWPQTALARTVSRFSKYDRTSGSAMAA